MKIYDNIPVPNRSNAGRSKYPFDRMEVGQSIFVALEEGEKATDAVKRVAGSAARYRRAQVVDTLKFSVRATKHPEGDFECVGVWRTA